MKLSVKFLLFFGSISLVSMLTCMERTIEEKKFLVLLSSGDYKNLAMSLWESTSKPELFKKLLTLLKHSGNVELEGKVAQAILNVAKNLRPHLFNNLMVEHTIAGESNGLIGRAVGVENLFPNCRGILLSNSGVKKLGIFDTVDKKISLHCNYSTMSDLEGYPGIPNFIVSADGKYLVYRKDCAIMCVETESGRQMSIDLSSAVFRDYLLSENRLYIVTCPVVLGQAHLEQLYVNVFNLEQLDRVEKSYNILESSAPEKQEFFGSFPIRSQRNKVICGISPDKRFLILELTNGKYLFCLETGCLKALRFPFDCGCCLFSKNGSYLIINWLGGGALWKLSGNEEPKILISVPPGEVAFCGPAERYIVVRNYRAAAEIQTSIIDVESGKKVCERLVSQHVLSSNGCYTAFVQGNTVSVYDLKTMEIVREIVADFSVQNCAISANGRYMAIVEANKTNDMSVFSVSSGELLMRAPAQSDKMDYYFYDNDERYLIGLRDIYHCGFGEACNWGSASAVLLWNVETGKHIGSWSSSGGPGNHIQPVRRHVELKNSCPELFFTSKLSMFIGGKTKKVYSFSITTLSMADVIAFDTSLNNIHSIEKALELTLVSNKSAMLFDVSKLNANRVGPLCFKCLMFDRLDTYDACLEYIRVQPGFSLQVQGELDGEPPAKRSKTEVPCDWLAFGQLSSEPDDKAMQLLVDTAQSIKDRIVHVDGLIDQYLNLPLDSRGQVDRSIDQPQLFAWYLKLKDMIKGLASGQQAVLPLEQRWKMYVLVDCLSWLQVGDLEKKLSFPFGKLQDQHQKQELVSTMQWLEGKAQSLRNRIEHINRLWQQYELLSANHNYRHEVDHCLSLLGITDSLACYRRNADEITALAYGEEIALSLERSKELVECLKDVQLMEDYLATQIKPWYKKWQDDQSIGSQNGSGEFDMQNFDDGYSQLW